MLFWTIAILFVAFVLVSVLAYIDARRQEEMVSEAEHELKPPKGYMSNPLD